MKKILTAVTFSLIGLISHAQAETLDGLLERGKTHSVLITASAASGDPIGYGFSNDSSAGQMILTQCKSSKFCKVKGAKTRTPKDESAFSDKFNPKITPVGWFEILSAKRAIPSNR